MNLPGPPPPPVAPGTGIPILEATEQAHGAGGLELDPAWIAERAARKPSPPPRRKRSPIIGIIVALLMIALVGVGVYALAIREPEAPARTIDGPGVSIRIIAIGAREVSIDGTYVGKTPLRVTLPTSATPVLITSPSLLPRQIVPDRDQVVNLTAR